MCFRSRFWFSGNTKFPPLHFFNNGSNSSFPSPQSFTCCRDTTSQWQGRYSLKLLHSEQLWSENSDDFWSEYSEEFWSYEQFWPRLSHHLGLTCVELAVSTFSQRRMQLGKTKKRDSIRCWHLIFSQKRMQLGRKYVSIKCKYWILIQGGSN